MIRSREQRPAGTGSVAGVVVALLLAMPAAPSAFAHDEGAPVLEEETEQPALADEGAATDDTSDAGAQAAGEATTPDGTGGHGAHAMQETAAPDGAGGHGTHAMEEAATPDGTGGHAAHAMAERADGGMSMNHPGLPLGWTLSVVLSSSVILGWAVAARPPTKTERRTWNLSAAPVLGPIVSFLHSSPVPLLILKILAAAAFILVVVSGFFGTVYPDISLATVLVWNWWWPLVVVSVLFVGTAWCAICPWDNLASWLVRRKLWRRAFPHPGYNRKVPKYLRNVWMALALFIALTWLELGIGVTHIPMATAMMGLALFGLAFVFLLLFERKAFCRYACPVGRTLGFYSRLAPIALRPREQATCDTCTTMECYRGSDDVEPCPSSLTIGKFSQNTYCLSCGNCVLSCPHKNVTWRLRPMGSEAMSEAPPTWDGAWFMLILLGITTFHGVTMLPFWTDLVTWIARAIGESGKVVWSFSIGMLGGFAAPVIVYAIAIAATLRLAQARVGYRQLFTALAFPTLPLAFTYHLAHNLDHLFREGGGVLALLFNPLGTGLEPMTAAERHAQMMNGAPEDLVFALQSGLMLLGIWLAVYILRYRAARILPRREAIRGVQLIPMLLFIGVVGIANLWLLSQDMVMRF